jgi:V/A-type H+-transporting ATPase subunit B
MKKVYEKIKDLRGNLITVEADGVSLGELARIDMQNGRSVFASVLRIDGHDVTLQVFQNTRGISTSDKVTFLKKEMQAVVSEELLGRRFNGSGVPIDGGPVIGGFYRYRGSIL